MTTDLQTEEMIPVTDRQRRERWAQELTRANQLEIALRKAEEAAADWQRIALANGELLARAQGQVAHLVEQRRQDWLTFERDVAEHMRVRQAYWARADKLAEYIETWWDDEALTTEEDHVRDLIKAAGVDCPDCDGYGTDYDEDMIPHGGASNGYSTRTVTVDCERCHGIGRVLR